MVVFIEDNKEEMSEFEKYYFSEIVPTVENINKIKDKYRTKFWGYLWTIIFLLCINLLISFFNFLINKHPINYEQLLLVNVIGILFIFYPIYQYYKAPKQDAFDTFLAYYGSWKHLKDTEVKLVHSPIIPPHDAVHAKHNVVAEYPNWSMEMRDTIYQSIDTGRKNIKHVRTVSSGIIMLFRFKKKINGQVLMFDKKGFYRKDEFPDLQNVGGNLLTPLAEMFYIFADSFALAEDLLPTLFFERVLDLKDTLGAKNLYVEIHDDIMRLYFEGAQLYFDNDKFWSRKINKDKFLQINTAIEQMLELLAIVQTGREQYAKY